jgi:hypothetical protein
MGFLSTDSAAILKSRIRAKTKRYDRHQQPTLSHFSKKDDAQYFSHQQKMHARVYFIGKLLRAKGLEKLFELQACYEKANRIYWEMNIFGSCRQTRSNSTRLFGQSISSCHCLELFSR